MSWTESCPTDSQYTDVQPYVGLLQQQTFFVPESDIDRGVVVLTVLSGLTCQLIKAHVIYIREFELTVHQDKLLPTEIVEHH